MRVAFFGGTFDPIHRGHLAVARAAVAGFRLGEVIFAPVGRQPLKAKTAEASFADRVAMVRLACQGQVTGALFRASEVDSPRPDTKPNYTVDTLAQMAEARPGTDLFAIAGADSFLTMRS